MEWFEAEVEQLERTLTRLERPAVPVVFYGSSSIRMWKTLARDLQSRRVLNAGFGGSTLAACVHFFERLVSPLEPSSLVVYAGDNDLGDGCSVEQVVCSFRRLVEKCDAAHPAIPFGLLGIKASPARTAVLDRIAAANAEMAAILRSRPYPSVFIDTAAAMQNAHRTPRPEYFEADGLHLSPLGYKLWADLIRPHRKQLLIEP